LEEALDLSLDRLLDDDDDDDDADDVYQHYSCRSDQNVVSSSSFTQQQCAFVYALSIYEWLDPLLLVIPLCRVIATRRNSSL
jgi:hypothetical protein